MENNTYLFYIDDSVSADYIFYDNNNNIINPYVGMKVYKYDKPNNITIDKYYAVYAKVYENTIWDIYLRDLATYGCDIGSGKTNSNIALSMINSPHTIWNICNSARNNKFDGYNDWYIPSKNELELLCKNKSILYNIDFDNYKYWTSSQRHNKIYAWYYDNIEKQCFAAMKHNNHNLLLIRSF